MLWVYFSVRSPLVVEFPIAELVWCKFLDFLLESYLVTSMDFPTSLMVLNLARSVLLKLMGDLRLIFVKLILGTLLGTVRYGPFFVISISIVELVMIESPVSKPIEGNFFVKFLTYYFAESVDFSGTKLLADIDPGNFLSGVNLIPLKPVVVVFKNNLS